MSKKAVLIAAPVALGALVLFWASLAAREELTGPVAHAKKKPPVPALAGTEPSTSPAPELRSPLPPATPENAPILARIRVLEERLLALEARKEALGAENKELERETAEKWAAASARSAAEWRVKSWEGLLGLNEAQKQALIELWTPWAREDAGRPAGRESWAARESELRPRLTAEQAARLSDSVSKQTSAMWSQMGRTMGSMAGVPKDELTRLQQALGDLRLPPGMLLPEAHGAEWQGLLREATSRARPLLSPEQTAKLEKAGGNR